MKVNKTLCDLCKSEKAEVATLSVPSGWLPDGGMTKHKVPNSEQQLFLTQMWAASGWGSGEVANRTFDVCRGCTEALLNSALWLKGVMEGSHE